MKISLGWLEEYLTIDHRATEVAEILTEIGLEVEGQEKFEHIKGSLEGLVVGQVLTCLKHPNADRLSLTAVDVGSQTLQIVCGAPNVAVGQKVIVAPVGTTLYDGDGIPWKINKGKIRGQISEGMICAEDEVGLGQRHEGILVLPEHYEVGSNLSTYYDIVSDTVFEVGLTPNRSDATSHLGVARDLAAALKINYNYKGQVEPPSVDGWSVDNYDHKVHVEVMPGEACPRYCGVSIVDIEVKESPAWLKHRLLAIGVRPINNVVDSTNYVLHELGQPLHAFDLAQIKRKSIKVQTLPKGSKFTTLDEQVRNLDEGDLMICDGADQGMCLAGVFGGLSSGVTADTKEIFLESAHFNARWTRRTSERHLLFTDASKVFEKGSDPNICVYALKRAAMLIKDLAGGQIGSDIVDIYPNPILPAEVMMRYDQLDKLVGTHIDRHEVIQILEAMAMRVIAKTEQAVTVEVPTNKVDVTREADLIEEVLRIYGFNRVPVSNRMSFSVSQTTGQDETSLRNRAANYLAAMGFNEIMGLSMIDAKYADSKVFQISDQELVRINNTSNVQMEVMRPNLWITALETVRNNQNRQQTSLRLCEFGKKYRKVGTEYEEKEVLAITISGWQKESWLESGVDQDHDYYALKAVIENILAIFGITNYKPSVEDISHLDYGMSYSFGDKTLVEFGKMNDGLGREMDIRNQVHYAAFDWANLIAVHQVDRVVVQESSKFPVVRRDLALIVERSVTFKELKSLMKANLGAVAQEIDLFDVYLNDEVLGEGKKSYAVSILLSDKTKTFSDKEIDHLIGGLVELLKKEVGARLR